MNSQAWGPLFRKVDCVRIPVPDLEAGLAFYRDQLGHALIWARPGLVYERAR